MRKIYSFMLALFATLCVGTAYALDPITITLNVDNPEAIEVYLGYSWTPLTLTVGDNPIEITPEEDYEGAYYPSVNIEVNEGYGVSEIVASVAEVPTFYAQYAGVYQLWPSELCDDVTYTVSTYAYADMRTDSVIVLIDDKTKATMSYGNGQSVLLDSTVNVVYFSTDEDVADLPLIVRAATYGSYLYEVTLNDSVIVDYGRGYQMYEVESGDTIRISANAPDGLTFPVIFAWAEGADKGSLDSLQVDGVTVDYKDTIEVAWGKEVKMWFNVKEYLVKVDNYTVSSYSPYHSETILDTTVWEITSAKYEDFDVTIIAHNPGCIQVQKASDYSYATLVEGTNTISLNTKSTYIYIRSSNDCVIDSVKVNGELRESYSSVQCEKNMTIEIWGDSIHRDQTFMLYVDTVAKYQYSMRTATSKYLAYYYSGPFLTDGYNTFAFAEVDNPISFSAGWSANPVCYQNDSIVTLNWGSCTLKLADGDVFKVFADTAEVYTVGIYVAGDAVVENATKDRIVAITDLKKNFDVLQGTEVSFETEATVLVNGVAVEGVDGVYTLVINENTTIVVGELTSCAEANVAEANTVLAMDEFVVAYVNGSYTYIQDATGSALIYKSNYGLNAGDTVTGLVGKISVYKNLVEIVPSMTVDKLNVKAGVAPEPVLQEELITLADVNKYIRLEGVKVNEADTFTTAGKETINAVWNDTPLVIYNQFKVAQIFSVDSLYDIVCAVSVFNEQLQVYLISAEDAGAIIDHVQLVGSWVDPWDGPNFVVNADTTALVATKELAEGKYWFGLKLLSPSNKEVAWMTNQGATITRDATSSVFAPQNGDAAVLVVDVAGEYVFTYDGETSTLTVTFPAKPEPEIAQYQLHGSWIENWGGPVLEIAEDQATASATVELNEGSYNFGIKQIDAAGNQTAWLWTANTNGDTFTREANAFVFVNEKEVSGKNPTLAADVDGVYTFVWTYADNTLTITFPAKPEGIFNATVDGQAVKFVRDGQLIIRMNGVEYNVLGAKLQ